MRNQLPTEHQEQVAVVKYCDLKRINIFAIPNGSHKSIQQRMKYKAEGLRSGVPDLFIPVPKNEYHGLFIELKRQKLSSTSNFQREWILLLNNNGYLAVICKGAYEAIKTIDDYFNSA